VSRPSALIDRLLALPRPLLLALDVDGTLAPIAPRPDEAKIPQATLALLKELASLAELEVALITGRDLASLGRMERIEGIWRGLEHGGLVLAPGQKPAKRAMAEDKVHALEAFAAWVRDEAPDAVLELKPQAVAVHVRPLLEADPERAEAILREADALGERLGLHIRRGRALREAEATEHDKGSALREIFERAGARSVFFAGDDITDTPAIQFAAEHGVGAFVRSPERPHSPVAAAVVLDGVAQLRRALSELLRRFDA
jgi:trehalose-phosphatase